MHCQIPICMATSINRNPHFHGRIWPLQIPFIKCTLRCYVQCLHSHLDSPVLAFDAVSGVYLGQMTGDIADAPDSHSSTLNLPFSPPLPLCLCYALVLIREPGPAQPALVQEVVLHVGPDTAESRHGHETSNHSPSLAVLGRVLLAEELLSDDARAVGGHDEDGHGNRPFASRLGVHGNPRAVDGVWPSRVSCVITQESWIKKGTHAKETRRPWTRSTW